MATKKYELLKDDTKEYCGRTLYRIKALVAIGLSVAAGDVGGYVEAEKNLSHEGNAWVSGNARVYGNARVSGDAELYGNAMVYGNAWVSGNAELSGNARVYGNARVQKHDDIQTYSGFGSENGTLTVYRTRDGIELTRGCFRGSLDQFRTAVKEKHGQSKYGKTYLSIADVIECWFSSEEEQKEAA